MQSIKTKLKSLMSNKRFEHSLNVAKFAKTLALSHNADTEKAYIAGLIHDSAKEFNPEKCKKYNITLENELHDIFDSYQDIWHALIVDQFADQVFGINDKETLNAAKYHCTGKRSMSKLAKIVFIADYLDPLRQLKDQSEIESLAKKSLNQAMLKVLINTIQHLINNRCMIYEDTIDCYNDITEQIRGEGIS